MEDPLDREIDLGAPDVDSTQPDRRWPIVTVALLFAAFAAVSVGLFLRSSAPAPIDDKKGVHETIVDLPAPNAPSASAPTSPKAMVDKPAAAPAVRGGAPAAPIAPVAPVTGRMLIRSTPADADVAVNGKLVGKTPLALRDLALGSYTIRVARDGYVPEQRTLHVTAQRPSSSATIDLRAEKSGPGGLNVQSRPAGARIYVNNRPAGSTPTSIPDLPAGPATVRIEMDGYRVWTAKVHVNTGEQTRVAASLERP